MSAVYCRPDVEDVEAAALGPRGLTRPASVFFIGCPVVMLWVVVR